MKPYKVLPTKEMGQVNDIQRAVDHVELNMDSPALAVFTDFEVQRPLMLEQSVPVDEALDMMRKSHVKLKIVIDQDEHFKGVISVTDLSSSKVMSVAVEDQISRDQVTVKSVMTDKDALHAIDIEDFRHASIGDVMTTMQHFGEQHTLVVDFERQCLVGIVSAADIARRLHIDLPVTERATSFADIYRTVKP